MVCQLYCHLFARCCCWCLSLTLQDCTPFRPDGQPGTPQVLNGTSVLTHLAEQIIGQLDSQVLVTCWLMYLAQ